MALVCRPLQRPDDHGALQRLSWALEGGLLPHQPGMVCDGICGQPQVVFLVGDFAGRMSGSMPALDDFARALLTFDTTMRLPALASVGLMLGAVIAAYIPYTHMAHFIAKYFTYHTVRWDDAPNNAQISKRIAEYLSYKPTWSAPHVTTGAGRTWLDVATTNPTVAPPGSAASAPAGGAAGAQSKAAGTGSASKEVRQ